ncbi:MAG: MBL fold metallo-hydrolase [Acidimicrobiia bacterium]
MEVADRVYRLGAELVNWFIIEDGGKVTLVDAGNPNQIDQLEPALATLDLSIADVEAVLLTHAHGDHLGSSATIKERARADVHVHDSDAALARGEGHREYERHYVRDLRHTYAWKSLLFFLRGGALKAPPVAELKTFAEGEQLDVPGRPRVLHTPGHTDGSSCLAIEDRDVVFTGDSLVTLNIVTGAQGPRVMPGSFNKNSAQALASLERLVSQLANVILPGHGEPWQGSVAAAVSQARRIGPS